MYVPLVALIEAPQMRRYHIKLLAHIALDVVVVATITIERRLVESLLSRGVSNRDDKACTLLQALAIEIHSTILSYEPVDMVTSSYNTRTLGQNI